LGLFYGIFSLYAISKGQGFQRPVFFSKQGFIFE
jgi:hypothetical protein